MKKITAILLLALLLYNAFGYYLLFAYQRELQRDMSLKNIQEAQYEVLKVNVAIYTTKENTDFEYVHNDIEIQGKTYHVVKKRIHNDSLELYYVRNHQQDQLRQNLNDIVESQTFDTPSNSDKPIKQLLKSFLKEYVSQNIIILVESYPQIVIQESCKIGIAPAMGLRSAYLSSPSPPPEWV